jgi:hypothetical protein
MRFSPLGMIEVPPQLQMHPKIRRCAKVLRQPERCAGSEAALPVDANAELTAPVPAYCFKLVSRRNLKVVERFRGQTWRVCLEFRPLQIHTWVSLSTFDQNGEPLLGEMMVVGQHLSETHLMHSVHGNTIHEAVRLISAAGVKIQSLHK